MHRLPGSAFPLALLATLTAACSDTGVTVHNSDPAASIVAPQDGQAFQAGETVALSGVVSDAEDAATEMVTTWTFGDETLCADAAVSADGTTSCDAVMGESDVSIVLMVTDSQGGVGTSAAVSVSVMEGHRKIKHTTRSTSNSEPLQPEPLLRRARAHGPLPHAVHA